MDWSDDSVGANPHVAEPAQVPLERCTELFESLFARERDLTSELLRELNRCSIEDLAKLFGVPASRTHGRQPGPVETSSTSPATEEAGTETPLPVPAAPAVPADPYKDTCDRLLAQLNAAKYDRNGNRLGPGRAAFRGSRNIG